MKTTTKPCRKCGLSKAPSEYYSKGRKCKLCRRGEVKALQLLHPERHTSRMKARREANPEFYASRVREWLDNNRTHVRAHKAKRRADKLQATPTWANLESIEEFYELARNETKVTGIQHEVDHIIPLRGRMVCGLHVEFNLQVITKLQNATKRNSFKDDE